MRKIRFILFLLIFSGVISLFLSKNLYTLSAGEFDENLYYEYDDEPIYDRDEEIQDEIMFPEDEEEEERIKKEQEEEERKERERERELEEERRKELEKARKPIIRFTKKLISGKKTKKEKLQAIHDGICKHAQYDWRMAAEGGSYFSDDDMEASILYNALHLLETKKGVCGNYASLFKESCKVIGVPCELSSAENHAWNEVKLGKEKLVVDVTWDDVKLNGKDFIQKHFLIKEHPITRKLAIRKKYLEKTKLPKYKPAYKKIAKNNIKTTDQFLKAMSYVRHMIETHPGKEMNFKFKITGKNVNASPDAIYLLPFFRWSFSFYNNIYNLTIVG